MHIGKAIRMCRIQRNMKQQQLADACELDHSYISLIERGLRDPVWDNLESIAAALGIPIVLLVYMAEEDENKDLLGVELQEKLARVILDLLKES